MRSAERPFLIQHGRLKNFKIRIFTKIFNTIYLKYSLINFPLVFKKLP